MDPSPAVLEVYCLESDAWRLVASFAGDQKVRAEPFEMIELDLGRLWAR